MVNQLTRLLNTLLLKVEGIEGKIMTALSTGSWLWFSAANSPDLVSGQGWDRGSRWRILILILLLDHMLLNNISWFS